MYSKTQSDTHNFDKAEDYILRAIQIAETLNNDIAKGIVYEKYANLKSRASNYSEAKKYLNKTLLAAKKSKDTLRESSVYWNLALIQSIEKRNDSAEFYYKKRISILENSTQQKELAVAHVNLGLFYSEQKNYTKAIPYFEKALILFNNKVDNRKEFEITTLKGLANAYFNSNNPNEAYVLLNKATAIKDSLQLYENNKNFLELETKYQTEKKEQAIKLLSAENLLEKRQKYIYISIACALLLLGMFFIRQLPK
ncbi:MAG: tetratricopeptide repeat protein [Flavobacterium sp.]|nr:tetratricopeptide repeat protein [Flavobacterium sp.]